MWLIGTVLLHIKIYNGHDTELSSVINYKPQLEFAYIHMAILKYYYAMFLSRTLRCLGGSLNLISTWMQR
jgi:hypothetical protein